MRFRSFMPLAPLVLFAGMAATASGQSARPAGPAADAGNADWRTEWLAQRNQIIETDAKLVYDPTSVMVQFAGDAKDERALMLMTLVGGEEIERWDLIPGLVHLRISVPVDDAINMLEAIGGVTGDIEFAEPDYIMHAVATPNDTFYSLEWGLNNTGQVIAGSDPGTANADIDANLAWDVTTGSAGVVVGCIDSGIRKTHEDLAANIWTNPGEIAGNGIDDDGDGYRDDTWGWNFYNNNNNPTDSNGHGSHTAGTIGAVSNNGKGVTGVAWNCRLAALKFLGPTGSGSVSGAISAINYCVTKSIKVSNNSWGGPGSSSLSSAISNARNAGHLMVIAAGNGGSDGIGDNNDVTPSYPASYTYDNIIAVAAIDNDNHLASFSNYGATSVDLAAPGVNVASCYNSSNSAYVYMSGTSMATPHVTGVAVLVWARNPGWTYSQVRSKILSTTKPLSSLTGKCVTGGCLNANNAVH